MAESFYSKPYGGYDKESEEAISNSKLAWSIMKDNGWTLNAFCAMWACFGVESGYNPWRWEGDDVPTYSDYINYYHDSSVHGYGFPQFTPPEKYISNATGYTGYSPNFDDAVGGIRDGKAQLNFINEEADYYPTGAFPISYSQYKSSTMSAYDLVEVWIRNYERPSESGIPIYLDRARPVAEYWYDLLSDIPPTPTKRKKMPVWMMLPWI